MMPLAQWFHLIPPPAPWESAAMVKSVVDSQHQWVQDERYHNLTFVYDNGVVNIRNRIWQAIDNSIQAAYNHRTPCLNEEKWLELCSYVMLYLGFYIDTRNMLITWPMEKWFQLAELIDKFLSQNPCIFLPSKCSTLPSLLWNAALIAPLGVYLSLWVQYTLNKGIQGV
jgi:hypothetical protein